ncbi:MAG TPA: 30S ribosome-binding factor RbfA [Dehalococcoidia bacterium]|nr:30S ribosome-binding factor RbfA [Dehalococcoidia bacterium]
MSRRLERLNTLLREELSELIRRRLKDPRVAEFVSITQVEVSPDLEVARVHVSVMGSQEDKTSTMTALTAASPYLRRELNGRITIRRIPRLQFELDETIEAGARLLDLINQVNRDEP